jgi:hypothetical protein
VDENYRVAGLGTVELVVQANAVAVELHTCR